MSAFSYKIKCLNRWTPIQNTQSWIWRKSK